MSIASFTIRSAIESDADGVARLACELGYSTTPDVMRGRIRAVSESSADSLFVATHANGVPIGWLHAHLAHLITSGLRVEILGLVVSPSVRRAGVGRALVTEAEHWAIQVGADSFVVRSNIIRLESHAFYSALGFSATKTQRVHQKLVSKQ